LSRFYDRLLLVAIVIVPLVPMLLYKWSYSLDTWYVPWGENRSDYFDTGFERAARQWLGKVASRGDAVYVITDSQCPCARPVLKKMNRALEGTVSARVHDAYRDRDDRYGLSSLVRYMPALPTALVVKSGKLRYVGPLVTGNLCSREARFSPPLAAYRTVTDGTVFNWLSKGCYCRVVPERLDQGAVSGSRPRSRSVTLSK